VDESVGARVELIDESGRVIASGAAGFG
jgi:hypothetical protein